MSLISLYNAKFLKEQEFYRIRESTLNKELMQKRIEEKEKLGIINFRFPLTDKERKYLQRRK